MGSSYVKAKELDLTSAHTDEEIPVGAQSFRVRTDSEVTVRLGSPSNPTRELKAGSVTRFCKKHPGESFDAIYVTNAAASGQLELEIEHDFIIEPEPGEDASSLPQPERLTGDLGAGEAIADGGEASENVDTADASSIRVRARVSGTTQLTTTDVYSSGGADPGGLAVDEDRGLLFVHDGGNTGAGGDPPELRVYEIVDADTINLLGSVTPAGFNDSNDRAGGIAYDPDEQVVVGFLTDPNNSHDNVLVYDVSDPSSPALDGSIEISTRGGTIGFVALDLGESLALVSWQTSGNEFVTLVDYSTTSAPSDVAELSATGGFGIVLDPDENVAWVSGDADVHLLKYSTAGLVERDTLTGYDNAHGVGIDPDLERAFVPDVSAGEVGIFDTSVTTHLQLVASPSLSVGSGVGVDPSRQVILVADSGDARVHAYTEDSIGGLLASASGLTDAEIAPAYESLGVFYAKHMAGANVTAVSTDTGSDQLVIIPLLTNGDRAGTGRSSSVTLRDGEEVMLDLDLGGEDQVEVVVQARSGVQTDVDYVEQYRR